MSNKKRDQKKTKISKPTVASAGGWEALKAVAITVREQMDWEPATKALLNTNQPDGFDCPGCAWPDKNHKSTFQFCENGAKAVTWEATKKRATPEVIGEHTVTQLLEWTDHALEDLGRLTHPMRYDAEQDKYVLIDWRTAFKDIAEQVHALPADSLDFYTSGRASNEAAFMYQLMARMLGVNNFPDCSNMCHEPTSVGLPRSIGQGKGTVSLEDFEHADLIISVGHNPGTNHPRMMEVLHDAAKRDVPIVVLNPIKEVALERFAMPQSMIELVGGKGVRIASHYLQVRSGGDVAAVKGIIKALLKKEEATHDVFDHDFLDQHTVGLDKLVENIHGTSWDAIEAQSGLSRSDLEVVAELYANAKSTIITYGMGITQHTQGTNNVRVLCDLLLLKGNIGRKGAGICPLRGHSNVQGNRTVGITEKPGEAFLHRLGEQFNFTPPKAFGRNAVTTLEAMISGDCKALFCLGGNLPVAMPDPQQCFPAMKSLELSVHIATKLNRSHLLTGKHSYVLPCLGRTEQDRQASGLQAITVEDSMSMVHASMGRLTPASPDLRSEVSIVCGLGEALLPDSGVDWQGFADDYSKIRDAIEAVFPDFEGYNEKIHHPGGFRLPLPATRREWLTPSKKAEFSNFDSIEEDPADGEDQLRLVTIRSHDQYNTTIYSYNDRYRGIAERRDILFMNEYDMNARQIKDGDRVEVTSGEFGDGIARSMSLTAVAYDIAPGTVAAYYPESNALISIKYRDEDAVIPAYKSIPVSLRLEASNTE